MTDLATTDVTFFTAFTLLTIEGWIVIGILGFMFLLAATAFVYRLTVINLRDSADLDFEEYIESLTIRKELKRIEDFPNTNSLKWQLTRDVANAAKSNAVTQQYTNALVLVSLMSESDLLRKNALWMTACVSGAPFIGLLGTVIGIVLTFMNVAVQGTLDLDSIAPGVAAALLTTFVGLLVAIPVMFAANYLSKRVSGRLNRIYGYGQRLYLIFADHVEEE